MIRSFRCIAALSSSPVTAAFADSSAAKKWPTCVHNFEHGSGGMVPLDRPMVYG
jgi:hypothetical protein